MILWGGKGKGGVSVFKVRELWGIYDTVTAVSNTACTSLCPGCLRKQGSILILGLEDGGKTSHLAGLRDRHDGASRGNLKDDVGR